MSSFPATRLRRLRRTGALRDLVRESSVSIDDLVLPVFVAPESLANDRLPAMSRHTCSISLRESGKYARPPLSFAIFRSTPSIFSAVPSRTVSKTCT